MIYDAEFGRARAMRDVGGMLRVWRWLETSTMDWRREWWVSFVGRFVGWRRVNAVDWGWAVDGMSVRVVRNGGV